MHSLSFDKVLCSANLRETDVDWSTAYINGGSSDSLVSIDFKVRSLCKNLGGDVCFGLISQNDTLAHYEKDQKTIIKRLGDSNSVRLIYSIFKSYLFVIKIRY